MKVVVLYHPKSDHAQAVEGFAHDFARQVGHKLELVSLESRDGASTATLYDVTQYPAILALNNSGELLRLWQGPVLPLMNEVAYFTVEQ